jgi:hypothetical protein
MTVMIRLSLGLVFGLLLFQNGGRLVFHVSLFLVIVYIPGTIFLSHKFAPLIFPL